MSSSAVGLNKRDIANYISLREATPSDDSPVGDLLVESFGQTNYEKMDGLVLSQARREDLRDVSARRHAGGVWVLELGYRIIGSYSLLKFPTADHWIADSLLLRCLAVHAEFHGLGFSGLMLEHARSIAASWKAATISLHVTKGANGLARLYQSHGYVRDAKGDNLFLGTAIEGYSLKIPTSLSLVSPHG